MFIKRSKKRVKGKVYEYAHLVTSYNSPGGPRHQALYTLGKMDSILPERDREIARKLANILSGQLSIHGEDKVVQKLYESMRPVKGARTGDPRSAGKESDAVDVCQDYPNVAEIEIVMPASVLVECDEVEVVQGQLIDVGTMIQKAPENLIKRQTDDIEFRDAREAGPVWVGHHIWEKLGLSSILRAQDFSEDEIRLTEILALNRLIEPSSEHATPEWVARTALSDILNKNLDDLNYRKLYGHLDRLHRARKPIESDLFAREASLFNLDTSIYLYDLTSTYFEGQCLGNPAAKYGYSRDKRSDCRQIVVGLMLNRDGFPIGHEVFDGNKVDCQTVESMIETLAERTGKKEGLTLTVDRGMSDQKNLDLIRSQNHHYIVAAKQTERQKWLAEFESTDGWHEIVRDPHPSDPRCVPTGVKVKLFEKTDEVLVLCISEGRVAKDRAIREKQETKFLSDLEKLKIRTNTGSLKTASKVYEAIGRLRERYQRVGRYYSIDFNEKLNTLTWKEDTEKKRHAEQVDGGYVLRTSRKDLTDEEIWRTYTLLTRVEAAVRDLKSPLAMRPIYHQLQQRAESHVFICILSYHLLVSIERLLQKAGITKSWETVRRKLSTHQVVSGVLRRRDGRAMEARRDTTANTEQRNIYDALGVPSQIFANSKVRWVDS
jgi:transposase